MKSRSNTDDNPRPPSSHSVQALNGDVRLAAPTGSAPRLPHLCSIGLSSALFFAACCFSAAARAESFYLATSSVEIPEVGRITNSVLCSSHYEVAFLPPRGWKENFDTNNLLLTWLANDYATMIQMKISPSEQVPSIDVDQVRHRVQERYPDGRITESFACYTAGHKGLAFDLEETRTNNLKSIIRIAFVPCEAGLAEFTLFTPADQASRVQLLLGEFMNSFQVTPRRGK